MTPKQSGSRSVSPVFYDFEATGLDGIPIEIGWACVDETANKIVSEARLIRAAPEQELACAWDEQAQQIHGITLETVMAEGRTPAEVLSHMNTTLAGRELFADSPFDFAWLQQLFATTDLEPAFELRVMLSSALCDRLAVLHNFDANEYAAIKAATAKTSPITHRADADARYWAHLWRALVQSRRTTRV